MNLRARIRAACGRDNIEAWANTGVGFVVSAALTELLRALDMWDANAFQVSAAFVLASYSRARILRWWFRRGER